MIDLAIIGAGPYGISLAAHAAARGLDYRLFGPPMHFWRERMPQNMFIRTNPAFVNLSDAEGRFTLEHFVEETGAELAQPLPRPVFVRYVMWFAEKTHIAFEYELIAQLQRITGGYKFLTSGGSAGYARRVIIATGLQHFEYIPDELAGFPASLVTHPIGYSDYGVFSGKRVVVLGSGQSSWEAAALLHLAGSDVELIYRCDAANYSPADNHGSGANLIALVESFYDLTPEEKQEHLKKPSGSIASFLRPYVEGKIKETAGVTISSASQTRDRRLLLRLSGGEERIVDHLIAATGYRVDIRKLPFLHKGLLQDLAQEQSGYGLFPHLDRHFESSLPGLFFAGPLASLSHGPAHRFIAGLHNACHSIISRILERNPEQATRNFDT
jgi:lysine/ornithine N-monooxygenase